MLAMLVSVAIARLILRVASETIINIVSIAAILISTAGVFYLFLHNDVLGTSGERIANALTPAMCALFLGLVGISVDAMRPQKAILISLAGTVFVFTCMMISYNPAGTTRPAWAEWLG